MQVAVLGMQIRKCNDMNIIIIVSAWRVLGQVIPRAFCCCCSADLPVSSKTKIIIRNIKVEYSTLYDLAIEVERTSGSDSVQLTGYESFRVSPASTRSFFKNFDSKVIKG